MAEPTGTQAGPREADLILGRKLLMEYDYGENAWKLVVDADLNIGDFEVGAVEIKDGVADYRGWVDSNNLLHVYDHASSGTMVVNIEGDYPEDSPMTNEDLGLYVLAVREDDMVSNVDAEGDFTSFQTDQYGRLWTFTTGSYVDARSRLQGWQTGSSSWQNLLVDANQYLVVTLGTSLEYTDDSVEAWLATGSYVGTLYDYMEDTAHVSGDRGAFVLGVREDDHISMVDAEGDYAPVQIDEYGRVKTFTTGSYIVNQNQAYNSDAGEWQSMLLDTNQYLQVTLGTRLDETQDEVTSYVTGTINNRGYYSDGGTWENLLVDANQYLMVTLGTRLDETQDEVTAYVTGTVNIRGYNTGTSSYDDIHIDENGYLVTTLGTRLTSTQDSVESILPTGTSVVLDVHEDIQRAPIDITGSGAAEYILVTGADSYKIGVMEVFMTTSSEVTARFQSGLTGTYLTGPIRLPNDGDGFFVGSPDCRDLYHFATEAGSDLILDLNAGCQMGGWILWYYEE